VSLGRLVVVGILVAAALSLVSALVTHDGVGAIEYVAGAVITLVLVLLAARLTFRARIG